MDFFYAFDLTWILFTLRRLTQRSYREDFKCLFCRSSPRNRALVCYLKERFPNFGRLKVYELSPYGTTSKKISQISGEYISSHYFPESPKSNHKNRRNENVESLSFAESSFDIVISQDVFEHVENPLKAFSEVSRVLRNEGSHIFTVPWIEDTKTKARVKVVNGQYEYVDPPQFHGDPFREEGALVITDFGQDLTELIFQNGGMKTTVNNIKKPHYGIIEAVKVFHSAKG